MRDFERRLALHDGGVAALARDLSERTAWSVRAGAPGFPAPEPRGGRPPDVLCDRGRETPPIVFEVELPETLVRRETVQRLCRLVDAALDTRLVMIADPDDHDRAIREASRMLRCVGIEIPVAAIAPETEHLTGASW